VGRDANLVRSNSSISKMKFWQHAFFLEASVHGSESLGHTEQIATENPKVGGSQSLNDGGSFRRRRSSWRCIGTLPHACDYYGLPEGSGFSPGDSPTLSPSLFIPPQSPTRRQSQRRHLSRRVRPCEFRTEIA
jgi:hypothetical protein